MLNNKIEEQVKRVSGLVSNSREIAVFAHAGQKDKLGEDYIHHPERVVGLTEIVAKEEFGLTDSDLLDNGDEYSDTQILLEELRAIAWLHDVIEDTDVTAEDLYHQGIPDVVVNAVLTLTKKKGQSNDDYYESVRTDYRARIVKIADMLDNTDPKRMMKLPDETRGRLMVKYLKGFKALR